jgi:signal recognition particle GTPase
MELTKEERVSSKKLLILMMLVLDGSTGQNAEQAKQFTATEVSCCGYQT